MKLNRKTVLSGIFAALLLLSTNGFALTLGRIRGAALLGKALDLSVLVQYAAEEDVSSSCFDADVHYGDTPLERSRISVKVQPGQQPNTQWVRVTSVASVDEALVRLTLKTVCGAKASRNYTVLADVVSEVSGAAPAFETGSSSDVVMRTNEPTTAANTAVANPNTSTAAPAKPANVPSVASRKSAARSALKLVPASIQPMGDTAGKNKSAAVNAAALEDLQRRVDDIAKWQATNSSAEDLQKSEARAKALEADIRGLQAVTAKNQKNIQMVADALESSSSQNYGRSLVYAFGAMLLAILAGLAYVVTRKRGEGLDAAPWWSTQEVRTRPAVATGVAPAPAASQYVADSASAALSEPSALAQEPSEYATAPATVHSPAVDGAAEPANSNSAMPLAVANAPVTLGRAGRPDFAPSAPGNLKSINTKEMLDVRQQAEFFMALGQHDEAVRLLESSIKGSADCNPLVFLDLLKIFHTLSRRSDFERYREEFNAQFTGRIPSYANFLQEGNGLEAYEDICHQIVVLWPTEYTIDFIEQCLVRLPEDDPEQGMDLEAFKDLLLLYGVLKRLDQGYDSNLAPFSTSRADPSENAPLSASFNAAATAPLPVASASYGAATAPMDIDIDLDLDLSEETKKPGSDNLIDFDMSAYMVQKNSGASE